MPSFFQKFKNLFSRRPAQPQGGQQNNDIGLLPQNLVAGLANQHLHGQNPVNQDQPIAPQGPIPGQQPPIVQPMGNNGVQNPLDQQPNQDGEQPIIQQPHQDGEQPLIPPPPPIPPVPFNLVIPRVPNVGPQDGDLQRRRDEAARRRQQGRNIQMGAQVRQERQERRRQLQQQQQLQGDNGAGLDHFFDVEIVQHENNQPPHGQGGNPPVNNIIGPEQAPVNDQIDQQDMPRKKTLEAAHYALHGAKGGFARRKKFNKGEVDANKAGQDAHEEITLRAELAQKLYMRDKAAKGFELQGYNNHYMFDRKYFSLHGFDEMFIKTIHGSRKEGFDQELDVFLQTMDQLVADEKAQAEEQDKEFDEAEFREKKMMEGGYGKLLEVFNEFMETDLALFNDTSDAYMLRNYTTLKMIGDRAQNMLEVVLPEILVAEYQYKVMTGFRGSEEKRRKFVAANNLAVAIQEYTEYMDVRFEIMKHPLYSLLYSELDGEINAYTLGIIKSRIKECEKQGLLTGSTAQLQSFLSLVFNDKQVKNSFTEERRGKTMLERIQEMADVNEDDFKIREGESDLPEADRELSGDALNQARQQDKSADAAWRGRKRLAKNEVVNTLQVINSGEAFEMDAIYGILTGVDSGLTSNQLKTVLSTRGDRATRSLNASAEMHKADAQTQLRNAVALSAVEKFNDDHPTRQVPEEQIPKLAAQLAYLVNVNNTDDYTAINAMIEKYFGDDLGDQEKVKKSKEDTYYSLFNSFLDSDKSKFEYTDDDKLINDYAYVKMVAERAAQMPQFIKDVRAEGVPFSPDRSSAILTFAAVVGDYFAFATLRMKLITDPNYQVFFMDSLFAPIEGEGDNEAQKRESKNNTGADILQRMVALQNDGTIRADLSSFIVNATTLKAFDTSLYQGTMQQRLDARGYKRKEIYNDHLLDYEIGLQLRKDLKGPGAAEDNLDDPEVIRAHEELPGKIKRYLAAASFVLTGQLKVYSEKEKKELMNGGNDIPGMAQREEMSKKARALFEKGFSSTQVRIKGFTYGIVRDEILSYTFADILSDISDGYILEHFDYIAERLNFATAIQVFVDTAESEGHHFPEKIKNNMLALVEMLNKYKEYITFKLGAMASPYYASLYDAAGMLEHVDYAEIIKRYSRIKQDEYPEDFTDYLANLAGAKSCKFLQYYNGENTRDGFGFKAVTDEDIPQEEKDKETHQLELSMRFLNSQEDAEKLRYMLTGQDIQLSVDEINKQTQLASIREKRADDALLQGKAYGDFLKTKAQKRSDEEQKDAREKKKREVQLTKLRRDRAQYQNILDQLGDGAGEQPDELVAKVRQRYQKNIEQLDVKIAAELEKVTAEEKEYYEAKRKETDGEKGEKVRAAIMAFIREDTAIFNDVTPGYIASNYANIMVKCSEAETVKNELLPKAINYKILSSDEIEAVSIKCDAIDKYSNYVQGLYSVITDPLGKLIFDDSMVLSNPQFDKIRDRLSAYIDDAKSKPELVILSTKMLIVEEQGSFIKSGDSMSARLKALGFVPRERYINEMSDDPEVRKNIEFMNEMHKKFGDGKAMTEEEINAQQAGIKARGQLTEAAKKIISGNELDKSLQQAKSDAATVAKFADLNKLDDNFIPKLLDDKYLVENFKDYIPGICLGTALYDIMVNNIDIPGAPRGAALRALRQKASDLNKAYQYIALKLKLISLPLYKDIYDDSTLKAYMSKADLDKKGPVDTRDDPNKELFLMLTESLKTSDFLASFSGVGSQVQEEREEENELQDQGEGGIENVGINMSSTMMDPAFGELKLILNGLMKDRQLAENPPKGKLPPGAKHAKAMLSKSRHEEIRNIVDQLKIALDVNNTFLPENDEDLMKRAESVTTMYDKISLWTGEFVNRYNNSALTVFNATNRVNNQALLQVMRRLRVLSDYAARQTYNSAKVTTVYFYKYGRRKEVKEPWTSIFYYSDQKIDFSEVVEKPDDVKKDSNTIFNEAKAAPENQGAMLVRDVDNIFLNYDPLSKVPAEQKADVEKDHNFSQRKPSRNRLVSAIGSVLNDRNGILDDDNAHVQAALDRVKTSYTDIAFRIKEYLELEGKINNEKPKEEIIENARLANFAEYIKEEAELINAKNKIDQDNYADNLTEVRNKYPNAKASLYEVIDLWRKQQAPQQPVPPQQDNQGNNDQH